jgi:hypothetical protein
LTPEGPDGTRSGVRRLELKRVRVCSKCGRGRAELEGGEGERIEVPLDAPRARALSGDRDEVRSLTELVLKQFAETRTTAGEVVLDRGPAGLRALVSISRSGATDLVECTAQEGVELAVRGGLALYATDEAFVPAGDASLPSGSRQTIH